MESAPSQKTWCQPAQGVQHLADRRAYEWVLGPRGSEQMMHRSRSSWPAQMTDQIIILHREDLLDPWWWSARQRRRAMAIYLRVVWALATDIRSEKSGQWCEWRLFLLLKDREVIWTEMRSSSSSSNRERSTFCICKSRLWARALAANAQLRLQWMPVKTIERTNQLLKSSGMLTER